MTHAPGDREKGAESRNRTAAEWDRKEKAMNAPGEDRIKRIEEQYRFAQEPWLREAVRDLLTHLREVEVLWEGAEAVIASQAKEMVETVNELHAVEEALAAQCEVNGFLQGELGVVGQKLLFAEEERNNWAKHYEMRCIALAQAEQERDNWRKMAEQLEYENVQAEQLVCEECGYRIPRQPSKEKE